MVSSEWDGKYRFSDLLAPGAGGRGLGVIALSVVIRGRTAGLQPLEEFIEAR